MEIGASLQLLENTLVHGSKGCLLYTSLFRIKAAEGLQYRVAALAGAATSVFWCLIEITVYTVFFTYGSRAALPETAGGMTLPQMVTYAWLAQLLFLMQPMSIDGDIQRKIESGDVGIELCRPLPLYLHWLAKSAAARLTPLIWRGSAVLLAGLLMPAAYRLGPPASLTGFLCALLSAGSAFLPVSYTHLDVYKRQDGAYPPPLPGGAGFRQL